MGELKKRINTNETIKMLNARISTIELENVQLKEYIEKLENDVFKRLDKLEIDLTELTRTVNEVLSIEKQQHAFKEYMKSSLD